MKADLRELDDRTRQAIAELRETIAERCPEAGFEIDLSSDDPASIHLFVIVDTDDLDEVGDLVIDRVVELQSEELIPLHVIPIRGAFRRTTATSPRSTLPLLGRSPVPNR